MAIFITQGRYTADAIKGMVDNPQNREKAVADLMEKAGAKLLALYITFGEYDFLSISEATNEEVMAFCRSRIWRRHSSKRYCPINLYHVRRP